jgi:predicted secreted Zn-dependent protease
VNWKFTTSYNGSVCRVTTFTTTTTVNITLPRWIIPTNAPETLKAEWARYIQALGQHEYSHAQIALSAAAEMQKAVNKMAEDASCDTLKQRLSSLCETAMQKYKQMDDSYDQRTEHGIKQGARLGRGGQRPFGREP